MSHRIGQWTDDLQLLDDGTRPPVRDDHRQRIGIFRANVDEVNVEAIDFGDELRQRVQPGFDFAPVIVGRPITCEFLHGCELHALRRVGHRFPLRPPGGLDASLQVNELRFRCVHMKCTNGSLVTAARLRDFSNGLIRVRECEAAQ